MNGPQFQEAIRRIYCMNESDFSEVFGKQGDYLWEKFKDYFNGNVGDFVCYLDQGNVELLVRHITPASKEKS